MTKMVLHTLYPIANINGIISIALTLKANKLFTSLKHFKAVATLLIMQCATFLWHSNSQRKHRIFNLIIEIGIGRYA